MPIVNTQLYDIDIEVIQCGSVRLDPSWHSEQSKNYFTRIYFVKSGNGYLMEGDKKTLLKPGSVYLIPSEHRFSYGCETLEKIFFHVLLPAGEKPDILSELGQILELPDSEELIEKVYDVYGKKDFYSQMQTKLLLYQTLDSAIGRYGITFDGGRELSTLTMAALRYIWSRVSIKLSANEIAQSLYVSESTLRNTFKAETGVAIGTYIDDAVFFTVRKMLGAGNQIDEITQRLGFCDRHYLSRRFKEKFGKTISQYKKEQLK